MKVKKILGLVLYYGIGIHMPRSYSRYSMGSRRFRQFCARLILGERCGAQVNIEKGATFGEGLTIGNYSGIGRNSSISSEVIIGDHVMMGPECLTIPQNHCIDDTSVPMDQQGILPPEPIVIGDDVWIGARVTLLKGVHIGTGSVIGAGSVVTKDIPPYEIWAGNPAHRIRKREKIDKPMGIDYDKI